MKNMVEILGEMVEIYIKYRENRRKYVRDKHKEIWWNKRKNGGK